MAYHYFLSANSARGYVSFDYPAKHIQYVTGYPSTLMQSLAGAAMALAAEQGLRLDIVHEPLCGGVTGLILPERSTGLLNTPCWLDRSRHVASLLADETRDEVQSVLQSAYDTYAAALKIHDAWEKIYIAVTDFAVLDQLRRTFCETVLPAASESQSTKPGRRTDAFFGAPTPEGPMDYIENLTRELPHRYFVKGRPGTGKSTFLKKIAEEALQSGIDVEVYHCAFDPESLDMLILREKGFCVFDSTAPHEYFPKRAGDEIVDVYAAAVRPGSDEQFAAQLGLCAQKYKEKTAAAAAMLGQAREAATAMEAQLHLDPARVALTVEDALNALFRA